MFVAKSDVPEVATNEKVTGGDLRKGKEGSLQFMGIYDLEFFYFVEVLCVAGN